MCDEDYDDEKICLSKEEAKYVYQSVKNETQVKPVHISKKNRQVSRCEHKPL